MAFLAGEMLNVCNCDAVFVHSEYLYVLAHIIKKN